MKKDLVKGAVGVLVLGAGTFINGIGMKMIKGLANNTAAIIEKKIDK